MIKLSIIIPMYNSELTIKRAIDSIGYNNKIEIILIDDGSYDATKNICKELCIKNQNIRYYYQENKGPGAARNQGINLATGQYIMFLDSDDYLITDILNCIVENELDLNTDILYYNFRQLKQDGTILRKYNLARFKAFSKKDLILYTMSWTLPWGQFKMIRRDLVINSELKFCEVANNSEELVFTIECLKNSKNIKFYDKYLYNYIKYNNSLSTSINIDKLYSGRKSIINQLHELYNDDYSVGIVNYAIITYLHMFKLLAKENGGYTKYCKSIRTNLHRLVKSANTAYLDMRYKILICALKFNLDKLVYLGFRILYNGSNERRF